MSQGCLITLEGIDGSGKSTLIKAIWTRLKNEYPDLHDNIIFTALPTAQFGVLVRETMKAESAAQDITKAWLYLADMHEHLVKIIQPAIMQGKHVICDRYTDSTRAYQFFGKEMNNAHWSWMMNRAITVRDCGEDRQILPSLTFWCDTPVDRAIGFLQQKGESVSVDIISLLTKASEGYKIIYDNQKQMNRNIVRLDCSGDIMILSHEQQVLDQIVAHLQGG